MAPKQKASGTAKKAVAANKQKAHSARFIKAAREVGVDESAKEFERAIEKIIPPKSGHRSQGVS